MTNAEVMSKLRDMCGRRSQAAVAREMGVSLSYLNAVMSRGQPPGPKILRAMGLRRQTVYLPIGAP
jgi:lambda repressor-like predicted transcriptional regulator